MAELHVTSGDVGAQEIGRRLGVAPHALLAWRDVLHDGPVHAHLDPAALRAERAAFLAMRGWSREDTARADLRARDEALAQAVDLATRVTLWFEDDLYDQLQLIQILDRLRDHNGPIALVDLPRPRNGSRGDLVHLYGNARLLGDADREATLQLAVRAWSVFGADDPEAIRELTLTGAPQLPHLAAALTRHLEELPATTDGLARTERQALEAIGDGARLRQDVFVAAMAREERPFMGDSSFWWWLAGLAAQPRPLVCDGTGGYELTPDGQACLAGRVDRLALAGGVDRWLGGLRVHGASPAWRWDPVAAAPRHVAAIE